jgi:hypothetical protein
LTTSRVDDINENGYCLLIRAEIDRVLGGKAENGCA